MSWKFQDGVEILNLYIHLLLLVSQDLIVRLWFLLPRFWIRILISIEEEAEEDDHQKAASSEAQ